MAKKIKLSQNKTATVDDADYAKVKDKKWTALNVGKTTYAVRRKSKEGGLVYLHREIQPTKGGQVVDHKNRAGLDDRSANLRSASQHTNQKDVPHNGKGKSKGKR